MDILLFGTYLVTISALIVTPGPNVLLMVSHSLEHGTRAALANALGGVSAALVLITIALFGVAALVPAPWMPWLSLAGSFYLIWLSVSALVKTNPGSPSDKVTPAPRKATGHFYRAAFFTGISNPKDILFFVLFLPQFLDKSLGRPTGSLLLAAGWFVCDFGLMFGYGLGAHRLARVFQGPGIVWAKRGVGGVLGVIGLVLAVASCREIFYR